MEAGAVEMDWNNMENSTGASGNSHSGDRGHVLIQTVLLKADTGADVQGQGLEKLDEHVKNIQVPQLFGEAKENSTTCSPQTVLLKADN